MVVWVEHSSGNAYPAGVVVWRMAEPMRNLGDQVWRLGEPPTTTSSSSSSSTTCHPEGVCLWKVVTVWDCETETFTPAAPFTPELVGCIQDNELPVLGWGNPVLNGNTCIYTWYGTTEQHCCTGLPAMCIAPPDAPDEPESSLCPCPPTTSTTTPAPTSSTTTPEGDPCNPITAHVSGHDTTVCGQPPLTGSCHNEFDGNAVCPRNGLLHWWDGPLPGLYAMIEIKFQGGWSAVASSYAGCSSTWSNSAPDAECPPTSGWVCTSHCGTAVPSLTISY